MMRRICLVVLLIITGLSVCWAAETLESKTLEVALDLSSESTITWYDFGFSSTQVGSGKEETPVAYEPTEIDHIALVLESGADADRIAENTDGSLWVYWHITSGSGLEISIAGDGDMKKEVPESEDEKIGWNIAIGSADGKGSGETQVVFTHDPSENSVGADGSKKILLATEDLTGLTLSPGEYTANLILSIVKN